MKQSIAILAAAFLLGSVSLAFAQQTQKDVQRQLEAQGYSQVHNIKAFPEGTSAQAMKDGKNWTVVVDSQGKIVKQELAAAQ